MPLTPPAENPFRRRQTPAWLVLLAVAGLLAWRILGPPDADLPPDIPPPTAGAPEPPAGELPQASLPTDGLLVEGVYRVRNVIDGDTFALADGTKVRLIGIDCPEVYPKTEPFGPEATAFTKEFLAGGRVELRFDLERLDPYGRALAYAWLGGRFLNEELLQNGLAEARTRFRYQDSMKRRFTQAEEEARIARRGLWNSSKKSAPANEP